MFFMLIAVADSIVILLAFVLHFDSVVLLVFLFFFFNDPAPTDIYPLSLPDALPISLRIRIPPPSPPQMDHAHLLQRPGGNLPGLHGRTRPAPRSLFRTPPLHRSALPHPRRHHHP